MLSETKFPTNSWFWSYSIPLNQRAHLGWPDSNPGRQIYSFQIHVAMSKCTNWPPKLSANMVIDHCTLNIQTCMIPFCVRSNVLVKMMYHKSLFLKCTMIYDYVCNSILRSILFALLQSSYQISAILRRSKWNF